MATILIATTPVAGHVFPALPIAARLVERGHDVQWYTGAGFADAVTATGARHRPITHPFDWTVTTMHDAVPQMRGTTGLTQVRTAFKHLFVDAAPGGLADLEAILAEFPADVVLADPLLRAAAWQHERGGPPYANLGTTMLGTYSRDTAPFGPALMPAAGPLGRVRNAVMNAVHRRIIFGPVNRHLDDTRERVGLPRQRRAIIDTFLSPYLYLQDTVESFEYPRSDLAPQVHFIGAITPPAPADFTPPAWWPELGDGPVVLVTQGTVRNENAELFGPTIEALADEPVLVVVTTGGGVELPRPLPANVRVEEFVPYAALMPHLSAYVTNGGYGGIQMALASGVPIVVAGATEDKPESAARVAWSGVGIRLRGLSPSAGDLRLAVRGVLDEPRYRDNARRIAADMAGHDAPTEAAVLLERLAATGAPVTRSGLTAVST